MLYDCYLYYYFTFFKSVNLGELDQSTSNTNLASIFFPNVLVISYLKMMSSWSNLGIVPHHTHHYQPVKKHIETGESEVGAKIHSDAKITLASFVFFFGGEGNEIPECPKCRSSGEVVSWRGWREGEAECLPYQKKEHLCSFVLLTPTLVLFASILLVSSLSHHLQGFIHPRWLAGFPNHQQYVGMFYDKCCGLFGIKNCWSNKNSSFFRPEISHDAKGVRRWTLWKVQEIQTTLAY